MLLWRIFIYIIIKDIHVCEDIDHVNAIFRKGPRETHMVLAGDLVPVNTMLVTPRLVCPYL